MSNKDFKEIVELRKQNARLMKQIDILMLYGIIILLITLTGIYKGNIPLLEIRLAFTGELAVIVGFLYLGLYFYTKKKIRKLEELV